MDLVWYITLAVVMVFGLSILVLGLPGTWLMIAAAGGYAWLTDGRYIGVKGLIVLVVIGLIAEVIETVAGGAGAKKAGGSGRAVWGGLIGGFVGALLFSIPIPIIGTIIGACLGAFVGAVIAEYSVKQHGEHSMRVGLAAAKGRFYGIVSKLGFGVVILVAGLWMALPWGGRTAASDQQPLLDLPPTSLPATTQSSTAPS